MQGTPFRTSEDYTQTDDDNNQSFTGTGTFTSATSNQEWNDGHFTSSADGSAYTETFGGERKRCRVLIRPDTFYLPPGRFLVAFAARFKLYGVRDGYNVVTTI